MDQQVRSQMRTTPRSRHGLPVAGHVLETIRSELPPLEEYHDGVWDTVLEPDRLTRVLTDKVVPQMMRGAQPGKPMAALSRESAIAGFLTYLKENGHTDVLRDLFYRPDTMMHRIPEVLRFRDPLELFDPFNDIGRVGLSPIGIVHLFRQYFFELDTFLGTPVSHVWLSPGSTVELVEISTRRTLVERYTETFEEAIAKTEKATTEEDEVSDAVKEDNRSETKFGMNATVNQGWIGGSATASSSIDMSTTQSKARETTHRHMRQQSEKLSTEIRKNFKSTFKTVTEQTDTASKRYVLANSTQELINYELRRKMRQVGVQVQDIGTYLCWQTYVDDPGRQLGIAKLVHVAKDPDVDVPPPEAIPNPVSIVTEHAIDIPFVPLTEDTVPDEDMDEAYRDGWEVNLDFNEGDHERIKATFGGQVAECDQPGYEYGEKIEFDYGGHDIQISLSGEVKEEPPGKIRYAVHLDHVNFHNASPLRVMAKVTWKPGQALIDEVEAKNQQKIDEFSQQTQREFEKAFVEAARKRIKESSEIVPRKFEELREEERIVVYRMLIQNMLMRYVPMPDDRTRHVVAELLNTIFDIDKMLYFVAPEWWRPRLHGSHQSLGGIREPVTGEVEIDAEIKEIDTVSWGGTGEDRPDNYFITSDSQPAKLGSSLGWLLQLDGDNLRNAFLNAPWVKAVIPIRPGKERAAINWLQRVNVEGAEGLDADYVAPAAELAEIPHSGPTVTIRDAINHLCDVVAAKHERATQVDEYPAEEIHDDNRVSATPIDRVYEHGFYPLQGGFRVMPGTEDFEVFDQWVEVLPTDQIVPVEVKYDPKTGRQI